MRLTGSVRLERGLFGDMVLQVQEMFHQVTLGSAINGYAHVCHRWRNATVHDISSVKLRMEILDLDRISSLRLKHRLFGGYRVEGLFKFPNGLEDWCWICAEDLLNVRVSGGL